MLYIQRKCDFLKEDFGVLIGTELFAGISPADLDGMLACLGARAVEYERGRPVLRSGERVTAFGVVLSGQVQIFQEDYFGNRSIFANAGPGQLFAESFACAEASALPVSVTALADSRLLFIDCGRLSAPCSRACGFHSRLVHNLLNILARKNIALTQKIEITSRRTTREKLLAYLSAQARQAGSGRFFIPFDRQELADYLSVDRSAMSAELGRLRDGGLLRFRKNRFELLRDWERADQSDV